MQKDASNLPEEIELHKDLFLDKTTCIYGGSNTGKSVVIAAILYLLRLVVPQILVVCPTDRENRTYSKKMVPLPLIHYRLDEDLLRRIWKRQEALSQIYAKVNEESILRRLFEKLQMRDINSVLQKAQYAKVETIKKLEEQYLDQVVRTKKIEEIESRYKEFFTMMYKTYVIRNRSVLSKMNLAPEEMFAIKHIDINPNLVLVLDDCSAELSKIKSKEGKYLLEQMFFQGRHVHITILIAVHDDTMLNSELRKNAFLNIFTQDLAANTYFERKSNGFTRKIVKQVSEWTPIVFTGFQKLLYIRNEAKFYRFTAEKKDNFCFGSELIRDYCNRIQMDENQVDNSNEFLKYFAETG